jgi:hypothetical protein
VIPHRGTSLEEDGMNILGELAQGLYNHDTRVESKLEVRTYDHGVVYLESINVTLVIHHAAHVGVDIANPSLSFH